MFIRPAAKQLDTKYTIIYPTCFSFFQASSWRYFTKRNTTLANYVMDVQLQI